MAWELLFKLVADKTPALVETWVNTTSHFLAKFDDGTYTANDAKEDLRAIGERVLDVWSVALFTVPRLWLPVARLSAQEGDNQVSTTIRLPQDYQAGTAQISLLTRVGDGSSMGAKISEASSDSITIAAPEPAVPLPGGSGGLYHGLAMVDGRTAASVIFLVRPPTP